MDEAKDRVMQLKEANIILEAELRGIESSPFYFDEDPNYVTTQLNEKPLISKTNFL